MFFIVREDFLMEVYLEYFKAMAIGNGSSGGGVNSFGDGRDDRRYIGGL